MLYYIVYFKCRLFIGLTPRHSGETSGVYLYGNGRMFARALRSRTVGYGQSGNSVLRDHPSCWRIHAYAFFEADFGADIPWQAPLKDGVSENHPVTALFREMFRKAVTPYARFAKIAKASELLPFTAEWEEFNDEQRAEILYGRKSPHAVQLFKQLPEEISNFSVPDDNLETVRLDGVTGDEYVHRLDDHAKYIRQIISKRDEGGPLLEIDVLKALNPKAFSDEKPVPRHKIKGKERKRQSMVKVSVELPSGKLEKLKKLFKRSTDSDVILAAVSFAIRRRGKRRKSKSRT